MEFIRVYQERLETRDAFPCQCLSAPLVQFGADSIELEEPIDNLDTQIPQMWTR